MSKENEMVNEYLSTISPDMEEIPKALLMNDLQGMGMDPQAPFMLLVDSMEGEYLNVDLIRAQTAPPPMQLTEGDKAIFEELIEAIEPDQPVPVSLWKAQLSDMELSQAHPFLTQLFDLHPEVELTRERVQRMAEESGLEVPPLASATDLGPEDEIGESVSTDKDSTAEKNNNEAFIDTEPGNQANINDSYNPGSQSQQGRGQKAHTPNEYSISPPTGPQFIPQEPAPQPNYVMDPGFAGLISGGIYGVSRLIGKVTRPLNPFSGTKADFFNSRKNSMQLGNKDSLGNKREEPIIGSGIGAPPTLSANDGGCANTIAERTRALSKKLRDGTATAEEVEQMTRECNHLGQQIESDEEFHLSAEDEQGLKEVLLDMKQTAEEQQTQSPQDDEKEKGRFKKAVEALINAIKNLYQKIVNRGNDHIPAASMSM